MYIHQYQLEILSKSVQASKVVVIYGPRRAGKTTLLNKFLEDKKNYLLVTGEDRFVQQELSSQSIQQLQNFIGTKKLLVIDEAQAIPNIGINLKLCVDHIKDLMIIATGSSAFGLNTQIGEPLAGRQIVLKLFPLAQLEINEIEDCSMREANLESRLLYGSYPEIVLSNSNTDKRDYLLELTNSYLCKDIFELEGLKKSKKILDLLQLLALQIGKEVSCSELGTQLGLNKKTIEKYLDLLEQAFVLINIRGFSRNLRKEISKTSRYYFYDTGVRNALINNFNNLTVRADVGELWENYIIMERLKKQHYLKLPTKNYFWRTYDQQEIDWVEESNGELCAYEIKWTKEHTKVPSAWLQAYPNSSFAVVNKFNYLGFVT